MCAEGLQCLFAEGVIAEGGQCCLAQGALIVSAEGLGCALCVRFEVASS